MMDFKRFKKATRNTKTREKRKKSCSRNSWINCGPMVEEKQHERKNLYEEEAERFREKSTGKERILDISNICLTSKCSKPASRTEAENP